MVKFSPEELERERERETERERERQRDRQTDRQTDTEDRETTKQRQTETDSRTDTQTRRHRDRRTDNRQTDRQTANQPDAQTERQRDTVRATRGNAWRIAMQHSNGMFHGTCQDADACPSIAVTLLRVVWELVARVCGNDEKRLGYSHRLPGAIMTTLVLLTTLAVAGGFDIADADRWHHLSPLPSLLLLLLLRLLLRHQHHHHHHNHHPPTATKATTTSPTPSAPLFRCDRHCCCDCHFRSRFKRYCFCSLVRSSMKTRNQGLRVFPIYFRRASIDGVSKCKYSVLDDASCGRAS